MVKTDHITAYIDRLRHRAAVMVDSAAELRDEATDRKARGAALDDLADALERIRDQDARNRGRHDPVLHHGPSAGHRRRRSRGRPRMNHRSPVDESVSD